jgi:translocon-associated protein subunit beta
MTDMMNVPLSIAVFSLFCVVLGADSENARLLASKTILNQFLVEDKDLTIQYDIYNVGASAALDVNLNDKSFPETDFEVVHGSLGVRWQRLGPSYNVSHIVILRPKKPGYFNFTSAELSYLPSESSTEAQLAYTSAPGEGVIANFRDYDRKFSPHFMDWSAFAIMTLPSLGIPFLLWRSSKSRYDSAKTKKSN